MNLYTMALIAILIIFGSICGSRMFNHYIRFKEKELGCRNQEEQDLIIRELERQGKTIAKLEERIQALETIITGDSYNLKDKFKNL